jgi:catechol 2,3-dioxygenase-like lactoylglutathione lyase family enzyme
MLASHDAVTMIGVKDVKSAKRFYQETLGLSQQGADYPDFVTFKSGNTLLNVYRSEYAGTNKATTAMWVVGKELDDLIDTLKRKGIRFEHYDLPNTRREGDVHIAGDIRVAWFKDPDGNSLSIQNR